MHTAEQTIRKRLIEINITSHVLKNIFISMNAFAVLSNRYKRETLKQFFFSTQIESIYLAASTIPRFDN